MIVGIGIDIIEIERIKNSVDNLGDFFLKKILTENEIKYCLSKPNKYQHIAARFAAKEAIYKACSSLYKLSWQDMEIFNDNDGKPNVILRNKAKDFFEGKYSILASITHSREYAACVAILELN
jgi:holo-[acyl-carrier protein] synthase